MHIHTQYSVGCDTDKRVDLLLQVRRTSTWTRWVFQRSQMTPTLCTMVVGISRQFWKWLGAGVRTACWLNALDAEGDICMSVAEGGWGPIRLGEWHGYGLENTEIVRFVRFVRSGIHMWVELSASWYLLYVLCMCIGVSRAGGIRFIGVLDVGWCVVDAYYLLHSYLTALYETDTAI